MARKNNAIKVTQAENVPNAKKDLMKHVQSTARESRNNQNFIKTN